MKCVLNFFWERVVNYSLIVDFGLYGVNIANSVYIANYLFFVLKMTYMHGYIMKYLWKCYNFLNIWYIKPIDVRSSKHIIGVAILFMTTWVLIIWTYNIINNGRDFFIARVRFYWKILSLKSPIIIMIILHLFWCDIFVI